MDDPHTKRMSEPPPQRVPPAPIQRIDWLAIAPWLILLRAPGATLGWPLLVGLLASIELSHGGVPTPANLGDLPGHAASAVAAFGRLPSLLVGDPARWSSWLGGVGAVGAGIGWMLAGLVVVGASARRLTGSTTTASGKRRVLFSPRWVGSLLGALTLLGVAAGGLGGLYWLVGRVATLNDTLAALLVPIGALLLGLPLALLLLSVAIGWPLLFAAIVIDDADPFDACSRAASYVSQRIGRLAFYVAVAAAVGLFAGTVLETILAAVVACTRFCVGSPDDNLMLQGAATASLQAARGFYPAYFISAWTAIYLLLRRDVDGQPIDEMASPSVQPSAEA